MHNLKIKISLFLNYFVFAILLNSVGTVIFQVQNTYGVSESAASILEFFKDFSIAVTSFIVASFIVRIGYKNAMLFALGFIILVCIAMPLTGGFAMTKLLFAATGVGFALTKVSVYASIGIITKDKNEHVSFMNFIESFFMIGILTGYFIFSAFVDDKNPTSENWLTVYYLLAGIAFCAFILLLTTKLDESVLQTDEVKPFLNDFKEMMRLIIYPLVLIFIFSAFFYVLIEQSIMSWLPTFNNKVLKLPPTLSIQMSSILAASTALGRFVAGLLLKKVYWLYLLVGCLLCAAILVILVIPLTGNLTSQTITTWSNAPIAAFIFPMIGLFLAPIYPAINSVILTNLPAKNHGAMSGLIVVFSALGGITGSVITGFIFEHYGGDSAFYFSLAPIAILAVLLIVFNRLQKKHETQTALNTQDKF